MAHIQLRGIQKKWDTIWGVRDVTIDIADEELLVLLGPSGCGKTTTLRMIAGLEEPTEGEITVDGQIINDVDARDRDVAMVFQGYALYPNMSIYENIPSPSACGTYQGARMTSACAKRLTWSNLVNFLTESPRPCLGGSASGLHWPGLSCVNRGCF